MKEIGIMENEEMFAYLDALRKSGQTNMSVSYTHLTLPTSDLV